MKNKIKQRVSQTLDIPPEAILDEPLIEIRGASAVSVDRHTAILEYTPERIHVATKTGIVAIKGEGLSITLLTRDRLEINGKLQAVELG